ncbi:hypothetical protein BS47DRAFT_404148 [Hydnum rufescens UP504]|uniref:Uncharacterized protein n=1 Tax=Hydnum rufescens UP504 TaxID=1448309 RepID=A0A9P6E2Q4_9AGAM|nr:hypothetical protein BS47DRAFT_404148 [Hydnum rufescens UP504]
MSLVSAAFANAVVKSSRAHRSKGPHQIQFTEDWRNNEIMEWHHSFGPRPTKIQMFQLRRERSKTLKHQYVVLILSDNCILRLDRRGEEDKPVDTMIAGTKSIDTIGDVKSLAHLDKTSDFLAELHCQSSNVDLLDIIKICFGIHRDHEAGRYTLQRFNCYFFAWTVLLATARHIVRWDTLPSDSPWETMSQTLANALSTRSADAMINLMINGTVAAVMATRHVLKSQLSRVMSRRARFAWAMPEWLIRFALRLMLQKSGMSGIQTALRLRMQSELLSTLRPTLYSVMKNMRLDTLRTTLWKEDVENAMRTAAQRDVMNNVLKAVTTAVSGLELTTDDVDAFRSQAGKWGDPDFLGGRKGDWRPAIIAAFRALVQASRRFAVPEAHVLITDNETWDEIWNSIRDIVRDASKEAMNEAMKETKEDGWTGLWDDFMEVWPAAWEALRPEIRDTARATLKELTELANDSLAYCVRETLPDTHVHLDVRDMGSRLRHVSRSKFIAGLANTTQSELQPYMLKHIQDHSRLVGRYRLGSPADVESDMRKAMGRVWTAVVDLDGGDASASGDHAEDVS